MKYEDLREIFIASLFAYLYVFTIYYEFRSKSSQKNKNETKKVMQKMIKSTFVCIIFILFFPFISKSNCSNKIKNNIFQNYTCKYKSLGLIPGLTKNNSLKKDLKYSLESAKIILKLYQAVIFDYLYKSKLNYNKILQDIKKMRPTVMNFKNYVFSPITEEIIYRAFILNLFLYRNFKKKKFVILFSPILFGFAHIYHVLETKEYDTNKITLILEILFKIFYTTIFGIFSNYLFFLHNNLFSCVIVHSMCNIIGFPKIYSLNKNYFYGCFYYLHIFFSVHCFFKLF